MRCCRVFHRTAIVCFLPCATFLTVRRFSDLLLQVFVLTALLFYVFLQLSTIITERDPEKVIDFRRISCRACAGQEGFRGIRLQSEKFISLILFTAPAPGGDFPRSGKEMEEHHRMIHYLRYCCAMLFALFSFLLATPLSAQAQTREAYVSQSEDKTTLTFYYDALRATRTGTTWGIEETKRVMLDGTFPGWAGTSQEVDTTTTRVVFDASFRDFRPTTTAKWFYDCNALKQIEGLEYLNTSEVTDMSRMFYGCSALTSLDLKHFNTQNVTNMKGMFRRCSALTSLDLQHFNTQNVTDMRIMFDDCKALKTLDLQNFNTQNVTDMYGMFWKCAALTSLDLKHFNTQNVIEMSLMFDGCAALTSLNLTNFNTQKVTSMCWMFHGCKALTSLDLKHFNTQNVVKMWSMFDGCAALPSLDLQHFNTQNVTDMSRMFSDCSALTSLDLQHFNTQNVTNMRGMFSGCSALTSLDLKNFETQNVTDMSSMFFACPALTTIYSNTAWRCPKSDDMFFCNPKLKGAVSYDGKNRDVMMANPETGYFTAKPTMVESYRRRAARKHLPNGVQVVNGKKTVKP